MIVRNQTWLAALLAAALAPAALACQTDDGIFDRDEGALEEAAEEVDDAFDR